MRKIYIKFTYTLLCVLLGANAFGQEELGNTLVGKVDKSTGTYAEVIPLITITSGGVSLPIAVNYNNQGFNPHQLSSIVGLNWQLSYGGHLSRTIVGQDDAFAYPEKQGLWFNEKSYSYDLEALELEDLYNNAELIPWANGKYDGLPDIWSFSIPGDGGSFSCDGDPYNSNFDFYFYSNSNVDFELHVNPVSLSGSNNRVRKAKIDSISLVNVSGIKSVFGYADYYLSDPTTIYFNEQQSYVYYSDTVEFSFPLKSIYNNNGKRLFEISYTNRIEELSLSSSVNYQNTPCNSYLPNEGPEYTDLTLYKQTKQFKSYVDSIVYDGGYVKFEYDDLRQDVEGSLKLNRLIRFNLVNGEFHEVEKVDLTYSYAGNGQEKKMLLKKIEWFNEEDELVNKKDFNYYNENITLPSKDHWSFDIAGNWNGRTDYSFPVFDDSDQLLRGYGNLTPSLYHTKILALRSITNLNFSSQHMEYDLHAYAIEDEFSEFLGGSRDTIKLHSNDHGQWIYFAVDVAQRVEYENIVGDISCPGYSTFVLQKKNETTNLYETINYFYADGNDDTYGFIISPGDFRIKIDAPDHSFYNCNREYDFYVFRSDIRRTDHYNREIGGLRLKSLTSISGNADTLSYIFDYSDVRNDSVSSGSLTRPISYFFELKDNYNNLSINSNCPYIFQSGSNMNQANFEWHSPITYKNVRMYVNDKNQSKENLGYSLHKFDFWNVSHINDGINRDRGIRVLSEHPLRGTEITESYDHSNKLVSRQTVVNLGSFNGPVYQPFEVRRLHLYDYAIGLHNPYLNQEFAVSVGYTGTSLRYLYSELNESFDEEGNLAQSVLIENINVSSYNNIEETRTVYSDGHYFFDRKSFSGDFEYSQVNDEPTLALKSAIAMNMVSLPIESVRIEKINGVDYVRSATLSIYGIIPTLNLSSIQLVKQFKLNLKDDVLRSDFIEAEVDNGYLVFDERYESSGTELEFSYNLNGDVVSMEEHIHGVTIDQVNTLTSEGEVIAQFASSPEIDPCHRLDASFLSFERDRLTNEVLSTDHWTFNEDFIVVGDILDAKNMSNEYIAGNVFTSTIAPGQTTVLSGTFNNCDKKGLYRLTYWKKGSVNVEIDEDNILGIVTENYGSWSKVVHEFERSNSFQVELILNGNSQINDVVLRRIDIDLTAKVLDYLGRLVVKIENENFSFYRARDKGRVTQVFNENGSVNKLIFYEDKLSAELDDYQGLRMVEFLDEDQFTSTWQNTFLSSSNIAANVTFQFKDGWDREKQSIAFNQGIDGFREIVSFNEYDEYGRTLKQHLPYEKTISANNLTFQTDYLAEQSSYYSTDLDYRPATTFPFEESRQEASPLARPLRIGGIGEAFQLDDQDIANEKSTKIEYSFNDAFEVIEWVITPSNVLGHTYHAANSLTKVYRKSPNGEESYVYTNSLGQKIAEKVIVRTWNNFVYEVGTPPGYTGPDVTTSKLPQGQFMSDKAYWHYYVYDDFGQLIYDIPRFAMEELTYYYPSFNTGTPAYIDYISHFDYDDRGRLIWKKVADGKTEEYVYNKYDQVVFTRTSLGSQEGWWSYVKYDQYGRVVEKGRHNSSQTRTQLQNAVNAQTVHWESYQSSNSSNNYYSNVTLPTNNRQVYNVYYFDSYPPYNSVFPFSSFPENTAATTLLYGKPTGSRTRIFTPTGTGLGDWLYTTMYYDDEGKVIQAYTQNHLGGFDRVDTYYDEQKRPIKTHQFHKRTSSSTPIEIINRTTFDNRGNVYQTFSKIDDDPEVEVSRNFYGAFGELIRKELHRPPGYSQPMQKIDYKYDEAGRLTHINDRELVEGDSPWDDNDVFGQELSYHSTDLYSSSSQITHTPHFGGNISAMAWKAKAPEVDGTTIDSHSYFYKYDDLSRMLEGKYAKAGPTNPGNYNLHIDRYSEYLNYDMAGNMRSLRRRAGTDIDKLTYTYNGYQLLALNDAALNTPSPQVKHFIENTTSQSEFVYNADGQMTSDANRGITASYHPTGHHRVIGDGDLNHNSAKYTYDASGNKLAYEITYAQDNVGGGTTQITGPRLDYVGPFVYRNGSLQHILTSEGAMRKTPASASNETDYVYDYFIKDYLNNVRVILTEENATTEYYKVTYEPQQAPTEELNYALVEETRIERPYDYPFDPDAPSSQYVGEVTTSTGKPIGPTKLMPVNAGDTLNISTKYFYRDETGEGLTDFNALTEEILLGLAVGGAQVLPYTEAQLLALVQGNNPVTNGLSSWLRNNFDTTDFSRPNAYLIYTLYDQDLNIVPESSGALRVVNPEQLGDLAALEIAPTKSGYLHVYVANSSAQAVNWDEVQITRLRGTVREINHYYPYGLQLMGIDTEGKSYPYKYGSKELQQDAWARQMVLGGDFINLDWLDFEARMYDPTVARWYNPDPAEQFMNPYLAMGNSPTVYVDPDGEFVFIVVGALIGAYIGGAMANDNLNPGKWDYQNANTWIGMGVGGAIGAFGGHALAASKAGTAAAGAGAASSKASVAATKSATMFGKTMTKTAGKKYFGATVGGTMNSISEYDGKDSFGWGTLADFGAGFGGSYVGISSGDKLAGFMMGGTLNTISQGFQNMNNPDYGSYNMAQSFVGGGLSSLVGMSYGMPKPAAPVGQTATLKSFGKSFTKYSSQSAMWDFAYTSQDEFAKRDFGDFVRLYGVGGALGASVDMLKFMTPDVSLRNPGARTSRIFRTGMNAAISLVELRMTSQLKGKPGYPKPQPNKAGVLGEKWLLNFLNYY